MAQILANSEVQGRAASLLWDAPAPLRLWHLASLDAPTVAVVWALGFAWAADIRLPAWVPVLLALVAWAVYIGDRLLDARAGTCIGQSDRLRERHIFHWKHRRVLAPLAVAAACGAAGMMLVLMPVAARERDTVLAAAALAYFGGVHSRLVPEVRHWLLPRTAPLPAKEMLVGVLFTAGCVLPCWNRSVDPWPLVAPVVFFAALAWLNCHAIERWESTAAHEGADPAFAVSEATPPQRTGPGAPIFNGANQSRWHSILFPAIMLAVAGLLLAVLISSAQPRPAVLIAAGAASALLLGLLDRLSARLTPLALRAAADLVLLTPLALLWR